MSESKLAESSFFSVSRNAIVWTLGISPVLLIVVLLETVSRNAYPPEGDTIFIPFISYIFYFFAFSMVVTLEIDSKVNNEDSILLWNPKRNRKSLFTLLISALMMWFWWAFLVISISVAAIGSTVICTLMIAVIPITRTMAIQNVAPKSNPFLCDSDLNDVSSKIEALDDRYLRLREELDRLKNDMI